jgi:hypothetical protein
MSLYSVNIQAIGRTLSYSWRELRASRLVNMYSELIRYV